MTDYRGVTWRVNYGEISDSEQFRVGYVNMESYDAYFPVAQLTDLITVLNTVSPTGLNTVVRGFNVQARKVSDGTVTNVIIEPRLDTGTPAKIMQVKQTDLADFIYALSLFQTDLPGNPAPDDWDANNPLTYAILNRQGKLDVSTLPPLPKSSLPGDLVYVDASGKIPSGKLPTIARTVVTEDPADPGTYLLTDPNDPGSPFAYTGYRPIGVKSDGSFPTRVVNWLASLIRTRLEKLSVDPRDYGAIGNGNPANASADTAGWQAALNAASASQGPGKLFVETVGNFYINQPLIHDYTVPVFAHAQLTSLINDSTKYMWVTDTTDPNDIASPVRHRAGQVHGLILQGDGVTNGVSFDGATAAKKPAHTTWQNCVIRSCGIGVFIGRNAYMSTFINCNNQGCDIGILHTGLANSGERPEWIGGEITGTRSKAFEISSDQAMHFTSVSMSYNVRQLGTTTQGQAYFTSCHLEFDSPVTNYAELTGAGGIMSFLNCRFLIGTRVGLTGVAVDAAGLATSSATHVFRGGDQVIVSASTVGAIPPGTYYILTTPTNKTFTLSATSGGSPIVPGTSGFISTTYVADFPLFNAVNVTSKVYINGAHIHGSASGLKYLGIGNGSIICTNTQTLNLSTLTPHVQQGVGLLADPGFELTTLADAWSNPTGAGDTLATSTDRAYAGSRSLKFTKNSASGTSSTFTVSLPVGPGARLLSSFWYYLEDAASTMTVNWYWATAKDVRVGNSLATSTRGPNAQGVWTQLKQNSMLYRSVPPWARFLQVQFSGTGVTTGTALFLDEFETSSF